MDPRDSLRAIVGRVASVLLAIDGAVSLGQSVLHLLGVGEQPRVLLVLHLVAGSLALAAAAGLRRARRWAAGATLAWGAAMLALFAALGPAVGMEPAERRQLLYPATVVVAACLAVGWATRQARTAA